MSSNAKEKVRRRYNSQSVGRTRKLDCLREVATKFYRAFIKIKKINAV